MKMIIDYLCTLIRMMAMDVVDVIMLVLAVAGAVVGFKSGFICQLGSVAGVVLGVISCHVFGQWASDVYMKLVPESDALASPEAVTVTSALLVLFLIVYFTVGLISTFLQEYLHKRKVDSSDKVFGAFAGFFQAVFAMSIFLNVWLMLVPSSGLFTTTHSLQNGPFEIMLDVVPFTLGADKMPSDMVSASPIAKETLTVS